MPPMTRVDFPFKTPQTIIEHQSNIFLEPVISLMVLFKSIYLYSIYFLMPKHNLHYEKNIYTLPFTGG